MKKKRGGGRHARTKGHSFERELAIMLRPIFPNARRQLEYHEGDCNGVDLMNTGFFKFQSKKCKSYVSVNTIDEIQCDRLIGDIPVLVTAADHKPAMAVLHWDDLLALIRSHVK